MNAFFRLALVVSTILWLSNPVLITAAAAIPPTADELTALKELPKGYVVWGGTWGPIGEATPGVFMAMLGDTAQKCLDISGTNPSINPKDPALLAYWAPTGPNAQTADIWLMDWQGHNKRKITKTPLAETALNCLRWTDQYKLTFSGVRPHPDLSYANDSIFIMDTLGNVSMINTGIIFNAPTGLHGFDGVMAVGNRLIVRALNGNLPGLGGVDGVALATFDQNHPETQCTFLYNGGTAGCGASLSYMSAAGTPLFSAINTVHHDAYEIRRGTDASYLATVPLSPSQGEDVHFWCWAVNDTNWAYTATRATAMYPFVVNSHTGKMYRVGFGAQGAAYGALYIGNMNANDSNLYINAPATGATFNFGDTMHVKWELGKGQVAMNVLLSPDNGTTWCTIASSVQPGSATWGNVAWMVTDSMLNGSGQKVSVAGNSSIVKVAAATGSKPQALSGVFSITKLSNVMVNLALNHYWNKWPESNDGGGYTNPGNAFDGNPGTSTGDGKTWAGIALTADFGKIETISSLTVVYADPNPPGDGYKIYGSNDGGTWTAIRTIAVAQAIDSQTNLNVSFRYIKCSFSTHGYDPWWGRPIAEIRMWGLGKGTGTIANKSAIAQAAILSTRRGNLFSFALNSSTPGNYEVGVFSLGGREMRHVRGRIGSADRDVSVRLDGLTRGTYIIKMNAAGQQYQGKAMVR